MDCVQRGFSKPGDSSGSASASGTVANLLKGFILEPTKSSIFLVGF